MTYYYLMIGNLNTWKILFENENNNTEKILLNNFNIQTPMSYLLNTNKSNYSVIEKFVYEIAIFHFNRLNINFDDNKYIEFWFKNNSSLDGNSFHFDCDEYDKDVNNPEKLLLPILSCVVYFNDNEIPTIITNIDKDTYKNKKFSENNTLVLSYPKYMKHITFDGGNNFHGISNFFENNNEKRDILAINLWDRKPLYIPYYDNLTYMNVVFAKKRERIKDAEEIIEKNVKLINIHLDMKNKKTIDLKNNDIINPGLFEDIFYNKKYNGISKLYEIIKEDLKNFDTFYFNLQNDKQNNNIETEYTNISRNVVLFNLNLPKFKQRLIIPDIFSLAVCDWIIKEFDKNNNTENTIKIENLKNVFSLILETVSIILEKITKNYCLDEKEVNYNIVEAIIKKNNENIENNENIDYDMKVSIALNDDYEGGGFQFEDEITTFLEKGTMIVHNSKIKHSIKEITKGTQYILQIYIKLIKIN